MAKAAEISSEAFAYFVGEVSGSGVVRMSSRPWEVAEALEYALASIGIQVHRYPAHQEAFSVS